MFTESLTPAPELENAFGPFESFNAWQAKGWFRRVSPIAVRSVEGRFTQEKADPQSRRRERLFVPHSGHSIQPTAPAGYASQPV